MSVPSFDAPPNEDANGRNGWLRLYVAGATPNSARAEQNLLTALQDLGGTATVDLTIIDVFKHSKRARADGVIVTPTLVCGGRDGRTVMMGDLADGPRLSLLLRALVLPR